MPLTIVRVVEKKSGWRWIAYLVIGVCLVLAISIASLHFPGWKPTRVESNLAAFVLVTLALLGYVLKWGWRFRQRTKFWLALGALATAHCAAFLYLCFYVKHWPILLTGPIIGVEAIGFAAVILWAVDRQ